MPRKPAPVGLERTAQEDFAAGAIRATTRTLISSRGTFDVLNGLHDDDGSVYRRGGNALKSATGAAPKWVWDGVLGPGLQRTVLATSGAFQVLDADDITRVSLGGAGLQAPVKAAVLDGMLFIPGGAIYGGSRKAADYSTGTVSGASDSKTLTGAGTTWSTNLDAGMLIRVGAAGRYYVIASVDSNTQVTLMQPLVATVPAATAYAATRLGTAAAHGVRAEAAALPLVAAHENRLVVAVGGIIYFSNGVDPATGGLRTQTWTATDFHAVPAGVSCVAIESLRDRLLTFTTAGIYAITNMAFNLVDAAGNVQQRMDRVTEDVVAWHASGICTFGNALVVPGIDDVYVVDGIGQPLVVSAALTPVLRERVAAGSRPGGATVFNGHLLLPVTDTLGVAEETWAIRLDRPVQTSRGLVFAWSRLNGGGAASTFVRRARQGAAPLLLGADGVDFAITNCTAFFAPSELAREDARGAFRWMVETRDWVTGDGQENLVRRLRARYELIDESGDARIASSVGTGALPTDTSAKWGAVLWGSFVWGSSASDDFVPLFGQAPPDDGRVPYAWAVEKHCRLVHFRIETSDACDRLVLRSLEFWIRRSRKI